MSWNKTHSKALEEKVARLKNANHRIREELKQCYKKIAELEEAQLTRKEWYQKGYNEAMKYKTCDGCIREAEDIQDPHCAFCSRACRDNFEPKEQ